MNQELMDALFAPLTKLREDYSLAAETATRLVAQLEAIEPRSLALPRGLKPQAAERPPVPPRSEEPEVSPSRPTVVNVVGADFENLLNLQEQLSSLKGVLRVSVTQLEPGHATLLVEMASGEPVSTPSLEPLTPRDVEFDDPTVLCAWCGRLISAGSPAVSHGLCPECAGPFVGERQSSR